MSHLVCAIKRRSCQRRRVLWEKFGDDASKESKMARAESGATFINESALSSDFSYPPVFIHAVKDIRIAKKMQPVTNIHLENKLFLLFCIKCKLPNFFG